MLSLVWPPYIHLFHIQQYLCFFPVSSFKDQYSQHSLPKVFLSDQTYAEISIHISPFAQLLYHCAMFLSQVFLTEYFVSHSLHLGRIQFKISFKLNFYPSFPLLPRDLYFTVCVQLGLSHTWQNVYSSK